MNSNGERETNEKPFTSTDVANGESLIYFVVCPDGKRPNLLDRIDEDGRISDRRVIICCFECVF